MTSPLFQNTLTTRALQLGVASALLLLPAIASAGWTHSVKHSYSGGKASVKVVGDEGIKVTVQTSSDSYSDSTPAIFSKIENVDAFLKVSARAKGADEVFSKKIEVKRGKQTVVELHYSADARPATKGDVPNHIGSVHNANDRCHPNKRAAQKYAFRQGSNTALELELKPGDKKKNVELPRGAYKVRVFENHNGSWDFARTVNFQVSKDGWSFEQGCEKAWSYNGVAHISHDKRFCLASKPSVPTFSNKCAGASYSWQPSKGGYFTLKSNKTNKCIGLKTIRGRTYGVFTNCGKAAGQQWRPTDISKKGFRMANKRGGCMNVDRKSNLVIDKCGKSLRLKLD